MRDNTAFKLTTAFYYTPKGRSIQATGITPDIFVEKTFGKSDLDRHITTNEKSGTGSNELYFTQLAIKDFELYQAMKNTKSDYASQKVDFYR